MQAAAVNAAEEDAEDVDADALKRTLKGAFTAAAPKAKGRAASAAGRGRGSGASKGKVSAGRGRGKK